MLGKVCSVCMWFWWAVASMQAYGQCSLTAKAEENGLLSRDGRPPGSAARSWAWLQYPNCTA